MLPLKKSVDKPVDDNVPRWYAVRVMYRREKMVDKRLQEKSVHCYLPLQVVFRKYASKTKKVIMPLINSYVFVFVTRRQFGYVLEDPDVFNFVRFGGQPNPIPEREIELLRWVTGEQIQVEVQPLSLERGDLVEIVSGQLTGIRGRILEQRSKNLYKVALMMESIQQELHLDIDPKLLKKVARPGAG